MSPKFGKVVCAGGVLWACVSGAFACAADEATATLRHEQREEAQALREQQAQEDLPAGASAADQAASREFQIRERAAQDALHARQLREQLQSSQIRQLGQQEPGQAAGQGQIQLQQFRREREAQRLQNELLRPPASAPRH